MSSSTSSSSEFEEPDESFLSVFSLCWSAMISAKSSLGTSSCPFTFTPQVNFELSDLRSSLVMLYWSRSNFSAISYSISSRIYCFSFSVASEFFASSLANSFSLTILSSFDFKSLISLPHFAMISSFLYDSLTSISICFWSLSTCSFSFTSWLVKD